MGRTITRCLAMLTVATATLTAGPASASVVEHAVTPSTDPALPGVDVTVVRGADGSFVFTLTVQPTTNEAYAPRVTARPGATPITSPWIDTDAEPLVARIVVPASEMRTSVISVMRDFGIVGHHYTIRAAAWLP